MKDSPPTVFVVDDDEAVRSSLKLLHTTLGLAAQAYASAREFLADFDPHRGGCLVRTVVDADGTAPATQSRR